MRPFYDSRQSREWTTTYRKNWEDSQRPNWNGDRRAAEASYEAALADQWDLERKEAAYFGALSSQQKAGYNEEVERQLEYEARETARDERREASRYSHLSQVAAAVRQADSALKAVETRAAGQFGSRSMSERYADTARSGADAARDGKTPASRYAGKVLASRSTAKTAARVEKTAKAAAKASRAADKALNALLRKSQSNTKSSTETKRQQRNAIGRAKEAKRALDRAVKNAERAAADAKKASRGKDQEKKANAAAAAATAEREVAERAKELRQAVDDAKSKVDEGNKKGKHSPDGKPSDAPKTPHDDPCEVPCTCNSAKDPCKDKPGTVCVKCEMEFGGARSKYRPSADADQLAGGSASDPTPVATNDGSARAASRGASDGRGADRAPGGKAGRESPIDLAALERAGNNAIDELLDKFVREFRGRSPNLDSKLRAHRKLLRRLAGEILALDAVLQRELIKLQAHGDADPREIDLAVDTVAFMQAYLKFQIASTLGASASIPGVHDFLAMVDLARTADEEYMELKGRPRELPMVELLQFDESVRGASKFYSTVTYYGRPGYSTDSTPDSDSPIDFAAKELDRRTRESESIVNPKLLEPGGWQLAWKEVSGGAGLSAAQRATIVGASIALAIMSWGIGGLVAGASSSVFGGLVGAAVGIGVAGAIEGAALVAVSHFVKTLGFVGLDSGAVLRGAGIGALVALASAGVMHAGGTLSGSVLHDVITPLADDVSWRLAYSQRWANYHFSKTAPFPYESSVERLAARVRAGTTRVAELPVRYVRTGGKRYLIVNSRTATALRRAGVPPSKWKLVDATGETMPGPSGATYDSHIAERLSSQSMDPRKARGSAPLGPEGVRSIDVYDFSYNRMGDYVFTTTL